LFLAGLFFPPPPPPPGKKKPAAAPAQSHMPWPFLFLVCMILTPSHILKHPNNHSLYVPSLYSGQWIDLLFTSHGPKHGVPEYSFLLI
jgi:hypothetical protein